MYRQSKKNSLSSNISSTCPHNMVNFGPLAAEIVSLVWGTPGNFNGFRVLAPLLHGTLVVGVSQTAALNRGRHLYSAGRPSRWALAHISSSDCFNNGDCFLPGHIVNHLLLCVQCVCLFKKWHPFMFAVVRAMSCLQCFDAVGWATGRASGL